MAEKYLTQAEWKSASKGTTWKADPMSRALAAFEKADKEDPTAAIAALAEVERQCDALAKAHRGDKALASFIGDVTKALVRRRAELHKAQQDAAAAGKRDDEDDGPDDKLTDAKKLLALLSLLKRDPELRLPFSVVDGRDDQEPLFVLGKKIAPKKLHAKLQELSGVKAGSFGQAWIEGQALILQVGNKPLAGLSKKARIPIRGCGFKVAKIVLWDEAGGVLEESADEAAAAQSPEAAAAPDPQRARFEQALAELVPRIQAALGANHPAAAKLREVLAFAREKAQATQFGPALQALEALQRLLGAPAGAGPAADAAAPPRGDYARCSKAWVATRTRLAEDVGRLRDAILAEYRGSPLLPEVASKVGRLDQMVGRFDANLAALLDQAEAAADEAGRIRLHREAAASIKRMLAQLDSDPILSRLADNPFVPIDPRSSLNATLQVLARQVP